MKRHEQADAAKLHAPMLGPMNKIWANALALANPQELSKGVSLILQGQELLDFYYLGQGMLRLMHCAEDGSERTILYYGPGNLFNESTAIAGYDAPDCAFFCVEDCLIYRFPGNCLHDPAFISAHPDLIINLMISQATKILMMHAGLGISVGNTSLGKISRFIYSLYIRHGEALKFDPCLTQYDIATLLGVHRASVVRALAELRRTGAVLKFTKHDIRIGDINILRQLAREHDLPKK